MNKSYFTEKRFSSKMFQIISASQLAFAYSKLTIETLEQGVKYAQS